MMNFIQIFSKFKLWSQNFNCPLQPSGCAFWVKMMPETNYILLAAKGQNSLTKLASEINCKFGSYEHNRGYADVDCACFLYPEVSHLFCHVNFQEKNKVQGSAKKLESSSSLTLPNLNETNWLAIYITTGSRTRSLTEIGKNSINQVDIILWTVKTQDWYCIALSPKVNKQTKQLYFLFLLKMCWRFIKIVLAAVILHIESLTATFIEHTEDFCKIVSSCCFNLQELHFHLRFNLCGHDLQTDNKRRHRTTWFFSESKLRCSI